MAQRRMISRTISTSRKLARVSDQAALLFTWLQPYTDDFGRMEGDAPTILGKVVPLRRWSVEKVEAYLVELATEGLIIRYTVGKDEYLEITKFEDHQTFKSDRKRRSEYPGPDDTGNQRIPQGSNWKPEGDIGPRKGSEVKRREVKGILSGENPALPANAADFIRFFTEATQGIRKVKPEIDGAKDGNLIKLRLKKLGGEMDRLEQMTIWYLTRRKKTQDGKSNWVEEFKNPPAIATMLSTSYFNQLLSEEANSRSYMAENIEWVSKVYKKAAPAKVDISGIDMKALLADRFRIKRDDNEEDHV